MSIKPILFNTEMVRAILDGRKTVTRRVVKPKYKKEEFGWRIIKNISTGSRYVEYTDEEEFGTGRLNMPPYQPGDILYVRETWSEWTGGYLYKAWNSPFSQPGQSSQMRWHPSIHMPKEAARIWLKVTDVRVERLRDIDTQGILQEGVEFNPVNEKVIHDDFHELWDSTIQKQDLNQYGWDANPWVWVIEFERCEKPEEV